MLVSNITLYLTVYSIVVSFWLMIYNIFESTNTLFLIGYITLTLGSIYIISKSYWNILMAKMYNDCTVYPLGGKILFVLSSVPILYFFMNIM